MKYCTRSVKSSLWFFFFLFFQFTNNKTLLYFTSPTQLQFCDLYLGWAHFPEGCLSGLCVCVFPVLQLICLFYFIAPSLPVISRLCSCALTSFKSKLSWFSAKFFLGQIWSCLKNVSSFIKTKQVLPQLFESLLRLRRLVDDILLVSHIR